MLMHAKHLNTTFKINPLQVTHIYTEDVSALEPKSTSRVMVAFSSGVDLEVDGSLEEVVQEWEKAMTTSLDGPVPFEDGPSLAPTADEISRANRELYLRAGPLLKPRVDKPAVVPVVPECKPVSTNCPSCGTVCVDADVKGVQVVLCQNCGWSAPVKG